MLRPSSAEWNETVQETTKALTTLLAGQVGSSPVTVLFDGLDRLHDLDAYESIVKQDLAALRALGIGVVVAASQRLLYGASTEIRRYFDRTHRIGATDAAFLRAVLRARADDVLLPHASADRVVHWSGGGLRDLISIAQGAGEEAYIDGADVILPEHVDAAANRFGRALFLGVEEPARKTLERVLTTPEFALASDTDVQLLVEDRIVESGGRYHVHPTLVPLLRAA